MTLENSLSEIRENNFILARFTAVVSDLHLCDEEPENKPNRLWKKFKTRQFFFDQDFQFFTQQIQKMANGEKVELVLNGDIFDFDSIMRLPKDPPYKVSKLEKQRGLFPEEQKSVYKITEILKDHPIWVAAIREFLLAGHRVIFTIGNHDLELHFLAVQKRIRKMLDIPAELQASVRFNEWFYISNQDTLIEHGNQYDPYCLAQDPINPFVRKYNKIEARLPFGNLAGRYMINGMGYFNPHVDSNFIMTIGEYIKFFFKYMLRTQPFIIWTWLTGALVTLFQSFTDRLLPDVKDPLAIEDRIEDVAKKANASPRMVRELKELTLFPAASDPILIARELWLDRAFLVLFAFIAIDFLFVNIQLIYAISFYWMFIPLFLFVPFFIFYSQNVTSQVMKYKEPNEKILELSSRITGVRRVVYGHTHVLRHQIIGITEHLNAGTWSPAFLDVECTKPFGHKAFVWIEPTEQGPRKASLMEYKNGEIQEVFRRASQIRVAK